MYTLGANYIRFIITGDKGIANVEIAFRTFSTSYRDFFKLMFYNESVIGDDSDESLNHTFYINIY